MTNKLRCRVKNSYLYFSDNDKLLRRLKTDYRGHNVTLETPDFLKMAQVSRQTAMKKAIEGERDGLRACGCHHRFLNTAAEIRSTGKGKVRAALPGLGALRAGFAASGAPLQGQIVYPTLSHACMHACERMQGNTQRCSLWSTRIDKVRILDYLDFETLSWISRSYLSRRKSTGQINQCLG